MPMRTSVATAWPSFCTKFEGRLSTMYLDTKSKVTTGTGNLIDSVAAAQALPWLTKDNKPATPAQIAAEWKQIKARVSLAPLGGYAFVKYATLHLDNATLDRLLADVTATFWTRLAKTLTAIESFPADAQLALLDLAWQNGPAFLDPGTAWTGTRAAVLAQDWTAAASHVPGTGARADARKRLFTNAAAVVRLGIDAAVLWNEKTPTKPKEPDVKYAPRHGAALAKYARSRVNDTYGVGWCQKFTNECGQTGSVGDWDGDKAADAEDGWKKAVANGKVVKAADVKYADIPAGVYHYWTGGSSDHGHAAVGIGGRRIVSTDMTDNGPRYGRIGECDITMPRIHWGLTYAGYALVEGNGYTLTDPPVEPKPNENKENELPTTSEVAKALATDKNFLAAVAKAVLDADAVPNEWADKDADPKVKGSVPNTTISIKTSLRRHDKQSIVNGQKLDALAALVEARFPQPPAA